MNDSRPGTHAILACVFAALVGVGAFISIPLPFTPIPIGLQTLFVLLTGLVLGPLWGASAIVLYLLVGLLGLPVFAAGTGGPAHLAGPTGGYLLGFLPAAVVAGLIARPGHGRPLRAPRPASPGATRPTGADRGSARPVYTRNTAGADGDAPINGKAGRAAGRSGGRMGWEVVAVLAGTLVVYACGVPWLKVIADMPWVAALTAGVLPFLPGDAVKAAAAVALAPAARLAIRRADTRFA